MHNKLNPCGGTLHTILSIFFHKTGDLSATLSIQIVILHFTFRLSDLCHGVLLNMFCAREAKLTAINFMSIVFCGDLFFIFCKAAPL